MRVRHFLTICFLACLATVAMAQNASKPNPSNVARGKYLVNNVGMCADCHSARDQKGAFVEEKWLQGSPLMFQPTVEMPWAGTAPPIAGMEGWTDQQAIRFLTTGVDKDGKQPRPPMPEYRFNKADAAAIVAFLRSLKQAAAPEKKEAMKSDSKPAAKK